MKYILVESKHVQDNWKMIFQLSGSNYTVIYMWEKFTKRWTKVHLPDASVPNPDIETITELTKEDLFAALL